MAADSNIVGPKLLSQYRCHDGWQRFYRHASTQIGLPMQFGVYVPDSAPSSGAAALIYLAGLTCTEETFPMKAGAQRYASEHGLVLISPDTSPRAAGFPGEDDDWDFGTGAGFYLDATTEPWKARYRMYSYIVDELHALAVQKFRLNAQRIGLFGHSMGGHGALVLAIRNPDKFRSVSAFAPIAAPMRCPWGKKAFTAYLGLDERAWQAYDASVLMARAKSPFAGGILIDQGLDDKFLAEQLYPDMFEQACRQAGQALTLRRHEGYDHGYYFISTFIEHHIRFHAEQLLA